MNIQHWIDISKPGYTTSLAFKLLADDNWSYFGNHERLNPIEKLKEQPRMNPTNPTNFTSGGGGQ